jgi:hypothetical protein
VKLALLLPLIFSIFILYSRAEIKGFLSIRPAVSDWLIFFSCAAGLFLMLSRSGNDGVSPHASELWVRSVLENIFGARPRFKEFMIGHPLMILGIYLSLKQDFSSSWLPRALILSGMVGIVSVVNTFEHLHTPVQISLLRTFHGCWIGAVSGLMLILIYERFLSRSQA